MVGILRGVLLFVVSPVFSVLLGIAVGRGHGLWYGVLGGFVAFFVLVAIAAKLANSGGKLTAVDCLIPLVLSIISGVVFAPVQLLVGSVFSVATCIFSGVLMSLGLFLYKAGKLKGWALILPALTFIYEMLPIELPTDLDNIFALGGSATMLYWGYVKRAVIAGSGSNRLLKAAAEADTAD